MRRQIPHIDRSFFPSFPHSLRFGRGFAFVVSAMLVGLLIVCVCHIGQAASGESEMTRLIDEMIRAQWNEAKIKPAPRSDDAEFFRRVYLDICGVVPPEEEVVQFLNDKGPDKRKAAIDRLMNTPLAAEHWANQMEVLLIGRQGKARGLPHEKLIDWLKRVYTDNTPYDKFVRDLLTAQGNVDENPAASYLLKLNGADRKGKPEEIAGSTARLFMGTQLQCAQCHHHKTEKWSQEDFWGMAAYFAQTRVQRVITPEIREMIREARSKDNKDNGDNKDNQRKDFKDLRNKLGPPQFEVVDGKYGNVTIPNTNKVVPAHFINGLKAPDTSGMNRRQEFAALLTSPRNPLFALATVNRWWDLYMGRGFVRPVDDLRDSNPPTHPELLKQLAEDFVAGGYDLKRLMRIILNSETYQLSSLPSSNTDDPDDPYFTRARLRPLKPEQLFYSLLAVTGIEDALKARRNANVEAIKEAFLRRFISFFDTDEMQEVVDFQGTVPQALFLLNGDLLNRGLGSLTGGTLQKIVNGSESDAKKIERLFLSVYGRMPMPSETRELVSYVNSNTHSAQKTASANSDGGMDDGLVKVASNGYWPYPSRWFGSGQWRFSYPGDWRWQPNNRNRNQRPQSRKTNNPRTRAAPAASPKMQAYEDILWAMLNSSQFVFNH